MIRNDFVSNSSSSSYVVYFKKDECSIENFIDNVCNNSTNNPIIFKQNKISLSYHLEYSRLLFLGEVYVKDIEFDFDKTKCPEYEDKKFWEEDFNVLYNIIKDEGKDGSLSQHGIEYNIINDNLIHEVEHYYIGQLVDNVRNRDFVYFLRTPDQEELLKETINNLINHYSQKVNDSKSAYITDAYNIQTYIIDESTVQLTEFMLNNGFKMRFDDWEDINKIKKLLENNNIIVVLRVNNHGCGQEQDTIYYTDDNRKRKVFQDIPVNFLHTTEE